jgi:hypothetical protein
MTLFSRGLKNIWSGAKNAKRSKKSQALRMTILQLLGDPKTNIFSDFDVSQIKLALMGHRLGWYGVAPSALGFAATRTGERTGKR